MAKTKRKRKHRGTQTGRVEARGRTSRKPKRQDSRRGGGLGPQRHDRPPTWSSAIYRGLFAAGIFFVLMLFLLGRTVGQAVALSIFMLAFYIPLGYYTDGFFYRRRQRQKQRAQQQQQQQHEQQQKG